MNIQTVNHKDISFISVTNPGNLEVKYLKSNFGFDTLHLDDYINKIQTPKIETFKNYSLIVLDFPLFSQNVNGVKEHEKGNPLIDNLLRPPKATLSSVPLPQFSAQEKRKAYPCRAPRARRISIHRTAVLFRQAPPGFCFFLPLPHRLKLIL